MAKNKIDPRWKQVGALIVQDREAVGLGQAELARKLDIIPTTMWRYEAGRCAIPIPRIEAIATELKQRPERYMLRAARKAPPQPPMTEAERRELYAQFARAATEAAVSDKPEARDAFNELIAEHMQRLGLRG